MAKKLANTRSDYSTITGIIAGMMMIGYAIAGSGNVFSFADLPSFVIVIGGTFAVTLACFSWTEVKDLGQSIKNTIFSRVSDSRNISEQAISIAEYAKKKGLLGLQDKEKEIDKHSLFAKGVRMLVDGSTINEIEQVIRQDIESALLRNKRSAAVLRRASEIAPAMGLIGTLIGLVQMLTQLNNPSNIGPYMAIALLTTLYGALLSYMVMTPLASKIERNSEEELLLNKIYLTSLISIGHEENPRKLERMINTILPPSQQVSIYKEHA